MESKITTEQVDAWLTEFRHRYQTSHRPIRVSFRSLCSPWSWAKRSDAYTHLMHRYPAKILPYIPIFFLSSHEYAGPDELVLDNFAGTGTVLLESVIHPYLKRSAIGVEINPLARLIAKVKTTPLPSGMLRQEAQRLISEIKTSICDAEIPEFANRDLWFSPRIQQELAKIRRCIERVEHPDLRDFFLVCFSNIIRDVSLADPKIAPPVLLKPEHFSRNPLRQLAMAALVRKKKLARPLTYFRQAMEKNMKRIETLNTIEELSDGKVKAEVVWDDSRALKVGKLVSGGRIEKSSAKPLKDGSVGLIITSPPYINAQKYVRSTKLELFWLGLVTYEELPGLDRQFVGTDRVFSYEYSAPSALGVGSADKAIQRIHDRSKEKAGVVSRYFHDMRQVMRETCRVLKKGGRFVLVIGDNTICGIKVPNHHILADIAAEDSGFDVETMLVDRIRSRGMITKRHETGGMLEDEYVLVLSKD
jgi:DNA modification methylase